MRRLIRRPSRPPRALLLAGDDPSTPSGQQVVALGHGRALQNRGWDVTVVARAPEDSCFQLDGMRVQTFRHRPSRNPVANLFRMRAGARGVMAALVPWAPTVVHGHDWLTYYFARRFFPAARRIFTVHDPLVYHQRMLGNYRGLGSIRCPLHRHIERQVYRSSHVVTVISRYTMQRMRLHRRVRAAMDLRILPDWIDAGRFTLADDREGVRRRFGYSPEDRVIFALRALEPRMGLPNLIRAFSLLKPGEPAARLVIGGSGPLRADLERLTQELAVDIELIGFVPEAELAARYQAADVVVVPSTDGEGFGLPIIEAMACGTPVLGTPVCAIPEVLSGRPERLFSGTAPTAIADGLREFLHLPKPRTPEADRAYVLNRYSENALAPRLVDVYEGR